MIIRNESKNKVLSRDGKIANNLKSNVFGLLFDDLTEVLVLKTRFGIHTFGMRKSLDVLILNNDLKVVKIKKNLKPWQIFIWNPKYDIVVEINPGLIKHGLEIGDRLSFKA